MQIQHQTRSSVAAEKAHNPPQTLETSVSIKFY